MSNAGGVLAFVSAAVVIVTALGSALAVLRSRQIRDALTLTQHSNDELRAQLLWEQGQRERDRDQCKQEVAELRGQLNVLKSGIVQDIVRTVQNEIRNATAKSREEDRKDYQATKEEARKDRRDERNA